VDVEFPPGDQPELFEALESRLRAGGSRGSRRGRNRRQRSALHRDGRTDGFRRGDKVSATRAAHHLCAGRRRTLGPHVLRSALPDESPRPEESRAGPSSSRGSAGVQSSRRRLTISETGTIQVKSDFICTFAKWLSMIVLFVASSALAKTVSRAGADPQHRLSAQGPLGCSPRRGNGRRGQRHVHEMQDAGVLPRQRSCSAR